MLRAMGAPLAPARLGPPARSAPGLWAVGRLEFPNGPWGLGRCLAGSAVGPGCQVSSGLLVGLGVGLECVQGCALCSQDTPQTGPGPAVEDRKGSGGSVTAPLEETLSGGSSPEPACPPALASHFGFISSS